MAGPAGLRIVSFDDGELRFVIDGVMRRARCHDDGQDLHLALDGAVFHFTEPSPFPNRDAGADPRRSRAPVAGVVAQVLVAVGDKVSAGQPLVCVEAMKMEMWLHAAADGTVTSVLSKLKESVAAGAVLVELEITE